MSPDYERKNNVYILAIGPESDGTYVAARKTEGWTRNDTRIERAIGKLWMQDRLKEGLTTQADISKSIAKKGLQAPTIKYELTRLPPGYSAFQRPQVQPNGTTRPQVGVFGHPNGHFTSINDFYVHFKHLTDCVKENDDRSMAFGGSGGENSLIVD
ncbi:hypothetical protein CLAFUW4_12788 [Fulvia fulva]|uniref:Cryptic loci regulator 2 N-terminal domain-containing protein n=1 Tax=Passalora fulva TaxID=5499 RepID=A0A9Q8PJ03_PASFU|nr:uncharacterized protein CLAFUR5_12655 [Fulvia fulva]KAK4612096.1 hypothetical protein CLAFUR4_12792 [Fulvia fulva]KAK4612447.1 hypothetical protein CLAFUR0_12798 [Fulvia fulva]UJO23370.1 hypothetical protein CLAFUR5_12655 [Fulvia fulva]WPV20872.1 hypothetical protein CLAFUW4_12788 [Fulvia fulva]WPV36440.1 hypothetical protein CLAFUW7_12795 [Fulvia fulva]